MTNLPVSYVSVELFDGRTLDFDPVTAERVDMLIATVPEEYISECNKMLLCITGARNGFLDMPNERWRTQFSKSLDPWLRSCDLGLTVGDTRVTLYDRLYLSDNKGKRRNG